MLMEQCLRILCFEGRITRKMWWMLIGKTALFEIIALSVFIWSSGLAYDLDVLVLRNAFPVIWLEGISFVIFTAFLLIITFFAHIKRFHDIGKSGSNCLWILLPFIGPLYILFILGFSKSDPNPNIYGQPCEQ